MGMIVNGFIEPITRTLPDGVRRRVEPPDRAADGGLGRLIDHEPMTDDADHHVDEAGARPTPATWLARRGPRRRRRELLGDADPVARRRGDLALHGICRVRPWTSRVHARFRAEPTACPATSRAGGGPSSRRAGGPSLIRAQPPRCVHHLDPTLEAKGVLVCDLDAPRPSTTRPGRQRLHRLRADRSTRSPSLHDAFLAGGTLPDVPRGVVVDRPIVGAALGRRGDGAAPLPAHAGRGARTAPRSTVVDRYGSPDVDTLASRRRDRDRSWATARTCATSRSRTGARGAHLAVAARRTRPRRRRCGSLVVGLGRRPRARGGRGAPRRVRASQRHARGLLRRRRPDARLPHAPGPRRAPHRSDLLFKGAVEDHCPSVYSGLVHLPARTRRRPTRIQTNRNLMLTEDAWAESIPNLEIETNDVKCSHASTRRPGRRGAASSTSRAAASRRRRPSA